MYPDYNEDDEQQFEEEETYADRYEEELIEEKEHEDIIDEANEEWDEEEWKYSN